MSKNDYMSISYMLCSQVNNITHTDPLQFFALLDWGRTVVLPQRDVGDLRPRRRLYVSKDMQRSYKPFSVENSDRDLLVVAVRKSASSYLNSMDLRIVNFAWARVRRIWAVAHWLQGGGVLLYCAQRVQL